MFQGFPEQHELVGFFGAEPAVLDPKVPWFYGTLSFATERDGLRLECEISPSYGQIRLRMISAGRDLLNADIGHIAALRLERRAGREIMLATIDPRDTERNALVLQLEPHVHVAWSSPP